MKHLNLNCKELLKYALLKAYDWDVVKAKLAYNWIVEPTEGADSDIDKPCTCNKSRRKMTIRF